MAIYHFPVMLYSVQTFGKFGKKRRKRENFQSTKKKVRGKYIHIMLFDSIYPARYSLLGHSDLRNQAWNRPSKVQIAPQRSGLGR